MKLFFSKLFSILTEHDKKFLFILIFISIIVSLIEMIGVGAILPFIFATIHRQKINNDPIKSVSKHKSFKQPSKHYTYHSLLHLRRKKILDNSDLNFKNLIIVDPVGHLGMVRIRDTRV